MPPFEEFGVRMMLQVKQPKISHSWWFDSHKSSPRSSPWLASTLQELDGKTTAMLKLIEQDADSFAQRAEMYYKKRPELVNMVEDFYRTHRSLAERFDLMRSESGARRLGQHGSPMKTQSTVNESKSKSSSNCFESEESDVEDPDDEAEDVSGQNKEKMKRMEEELCRLREENAALRAQLLSKDEEKREVIRQLSLSISILKEESAEMRKRPKESQTRAVPFEWKKFFGGFSKFHPAMVAL